MTKKNVWRKTADLHGDFIFLIFPFLLFAFLFNLHGHSQQNLLPEKTISMQADFFSADHLGNIYSVKGGQLEKFSSDGKPENSYSSKILGNITAMDVSNPMKIVLFYKNLSQVVFLDNTLSRQGDPVALENTGLEQAILVCSSVNNGIWVYDQRNFQLVRMDQNLKMVAETGNITQQTGGELNPDFLIEKNNRLYLNDTSRGILVFDVFGTYSKTIPLKNAGNIHVVEDFLFFIREGKFFSFSLKMLEQKEIVLPETECRQVLAEGGKIYILKENELKVYSGKENK